MKWSLFVFVSVFFGSLPLSAQTAYVSVVELEPEEYWWGGVVGLGTKMPYVKQEAYNLETRNNNNQVVPLLLSNKGRYIWSDYPFTFSVEEGKIRLVSKYEENLAPVKAGTDLRGAYLAACAKHFLPTGQLPDTLFFTMPQYNTWIELQYNQNQEDILKYAHSVIDHGFPPGVLMIDDNWQKYYGNFEFKPERFPDPKAMVDELHALGFKVMLWICPFVSPDSSEARELSARGFLLKQKGSWAPAIIHWWNGQSACFDLTHPEAKAYLTEQLKAVQKKYGIDGYKWDGGDNNFYNMSVMEGYRKNALSVDHTEAWARMGLEFPFNEYRAGWKMGGEPLVQRLGDKNYSWSNGVQWLIPEMIAAGLLGYAYTCPDMIGGGQISSFTTTSIEKLDKNIFIRSAQTHALMPMMQFSLSPWRILDENQVEIVRNAALLHEKMGTYIIACARSAAQTGEPIVRHMEYSFPHQGFATCKDQFMLGEKYLVAPVVTPDTVRMVKLPKGRWRDDQGKVYRGGRTITVEVPLERLLYFEKLS